MFGMGFTEILIIAVIAILFLGPDNLPKAMIEVAKFFRSIKKTVGTVKSSLEEEMNITDIKREALAYKKELLDASNDLKDSTGISDLGASLTDLHDDLSLEETKAPSKNSLDVPDEISFTKKDTTIKTEKEETKDV